MKNTVLGIEFARKFCARIDSLQLSIVLVVIFFRNNVNMFRTLV